MKYLFSIFALILGLNAQVRPEHTPGQGGNHRRPPEVSKQIRQEMLKKYDLNKDGKLDREERSKISKEDRKKMHPPRKGPKDSPPTERG